MFNISFFMLTFTCLIWQSNGDNILFFFGFGTYSHRIAIWPLVEKLTERGHNVTFVQRFHSKSVHPKVHEFLPKGLENVAKEFENVDFLSTRLQGGHWSTIQLGTKMPQKALRVCEGFLNDAQTKEWIKSCNFSLIVIDALFNECAVALAYKFKAKFILYSTTHMFGWWGDEFGFPVESSTIPDHHVAFQYPMSFYGRSVSTLVELGLYLYKKFAFYPALDKVVRENLGDEMPDVESLIKNVSLLFANTHFSEEVARSVPPLVVSIGGMHCGETDGKLDEDLKNFIEDSDGFIYISFGSTARICNTPKEFQSIFYEALSQSDMKFVWKFECNRTSEVPPNVYTADWMPQQTILAHPKLKAFFTHGGLLSLHESVWHGVPLLVMPIFADQTYNGYRIDRTKRGILIDPNNLTADILSDAIKLIVKNSQYKENMKKTSKLFRDRPETPLQSAIWWTEFVLRNDHSVHTTLKPLGIDECWYQRRLLDVWLLIFILIAISSILTLIIIKKILRFIFLHLIHSLQFQLRRKTNVKVE